MAKKNRTEEKDPETAAAAIAVAVENPLSTFAELARMSGLSPNLIKAVMRRMDAGHPEAMAELKGLSHHELLKSLDSKIAMALEYMDPVAFGGASLRDLTIALGIMIEKKQLLQGQPTAILGVLERKNINELLPALVREATRRGITIDVTPEQGVRAIPPEIPHDAGLSATARKFPPAPVEVSFD